MIEKVHIPPIKIQGIKTKIVPLIAELERCEEEGTWYEPFMGSGVVGLNLAPKHAVFSDTNPYVIELYKQIKEDKINSYVVREFLEYEGEQLALKDEEHYYYIRDRFNESHNPLDFLFLNRSCFNGMIRFNKNYKFNVPYGHKPQRFSKAYITKIVNQVKYVEQMLCISDWNFICQSFDNTINSIQEERAFIYCDPPYIGRNVDYYDSWSEDEETKLKKMLISNNNYFMLSTWDHNKYRKNEYVDTLWGFCKKINKEHFYYVGANENNRNSIVEALLINY